MAGDLINTLQNNHTGYLLRACYIPATVLDVHCQPLQNGHRDVSRELISSHFIDEESETQIVNNLLKVKELTSGSRKIQTPLPSSLPPPPPLS